MSITLTTRSLLLGALFLGFIPAAAFAGEAVELARGSGDREPKQPQVAVGADGMIHVVYGAGDVIRYHRSSDGGQTFSRAIDLPVVHAMPLGKRRGPRVAVTKESICVTAVGGKQGKGRDGDVLALRSLDAGKTWSDPVRVNDVADAAREGLHGMAGWPGGDLCCVWLDLRNGKSEIMSSTSSDGGASWTKNVVVYQSPDGAVCPCCHPSVTFDAQGRIHVLWRNALAGARDMYVASSANRGKTFGKASKLGNGTWPLDACPMDGGAIAVGADGKIAAAWRREKDVYLSRSGEDEEQWLGPGEQPWITVTQAGPFVVWLTKRGESALLLTPGGAKPATLARHAGDPVIAADPAGLGPVVAAWESRDGGVAGIVCQVVRERAAN